MDELKGNFSQNGFHIEDDELILTKLYGEVRSKSWEDNLLAKYLGWHEIAHAADHRREQMGLPSVEECKQSFLEELDAEIKRLERYEAERASTESRRMEIEAIRHNVPDAPRLDRLLKYETALERALDRILNQIERRQRMRLGQPVHPQINVDVSSQ